MGRSICAGLRERDRGPETLAFRCATLSSIQCPALGLAETSCSQLKLDIPLQPFQIKQSWAKGPVVHEDNDLLQGSES